MSRLQRLVPFVTLLWLAAPAALRAGDVEIVRVMPGWRDAASFRRISEYFTGKENTGGITVLRSRPDDRAGYYWLVRVKNPGAVISGARFELQVIALGSPQPKTFKFPAALRAGSALYDLGLTGGDWPAPKARPAAWHLQILSGDGQVLAEKKSFLWTPPAG